MKGLALLRHAKSGWADPGAHDFDRSLNARGKQAAEAIGREMRRLGLAFDAIVISPAVRAVETLAHASRGYCAALATREDKRLYLASPATLLAIVRETDDAVDRLLLVGHNPGFELLAAALTEGDGTALRATMAEKYPTGALAKIEFDVDSWRDVQPATGHLVRFIRPRDLER